MKMTRQEFNDWIWSAPLPRLLEGSGLGAKSLRKICKHHDVPLPPRGFWAGSDERRRVTRTPLPRPEDNHEIEVPMTSPRGKRAETPRPSPARPSTTIREKTVSPPADVHASTLPSKGDPRGTRSKEADSEVDEKVRPEAIVSLALEWARVQKAERLIAELRQVAATADAPAAASILLWASEAEQHLHRNDPLRRVLANCKRPS